LTPGKDGLKQLELRLGIEVVKKCSFGKVPESPWGDLASGTLPEHYFTAPHSVTRLLKNKHLTFVSLSSIVRVVLTGSGAGNTSSWIKQLPPGETSKRPATLQSVASRMGDSYRGLWWTKALGKTEL
jgi:hypothetical protein